MRARRFFLSAGIAGGALIGVLAAGESGALAATPEIGSWGQAWGDDAADLAPASPTPQQRAVVPQAAVPPPGRVPQAQPLQRAPSAAEIGGWGDAWGDGSAAVNVPPQVAAPVAAAPPPLPTTSSGPSAAEIGSWGDAWENDDLPPQGNAARAQPLAAAAAATPTPPTPSPAIPVQAPSTVAADDAATGATTPLAAGARLGDTESPVQLTADQIVYDRELGIVTAKGRVEIVQDTRMLVADQVSYNLKQDLVAASGNVTLAEPGGETLFTDYMELTGDLKEGVAQQIRAVLADNSRMAAASATRVGGDRTDFEDASYTACEPCRNKPDSRPLWEAKAKRITHNQAEHTIEYRDVWMELGGVPVLYTPYLSHPDPTVKRQSGFLTPTGGVSSNIGTNVTVPYFWAIKDNQDITFAPRFLFPSSTAKRARDLRESDSLLRHVVLAGEHRWRGMEGETRTIASLTGDKYTGDLRGHIDARGRFDLNNNWRAGYRIERASDDTYNQIYSYRFDADRPLLISRPYVEGFGRNSYTVAEAFSYQGLLRDDSPSLSPLVLPHISTSHMSMPDAKGGFFTFDSDALSYMRSSGVSSTRLSNTVGWQRPYMGSLGDITTISTSLRGDVYHSENVPGYGSVNSGRAVPLVAANWRMPFARPSQTFPQIIEPMAMVAASPNGGNSDRIPNEDSIGFELDEINVFRPNRMHGLDRVEGGVRGAYGLRWQGLVPQGGSVTAVVAQGWRARNDSTFRPGSGFQDTLSDYVGRLDVTPSPNLSLLNRIRIDKDNGEIRRNESTLSIGSPILRTSVSYVMYDGIEDDDITFEGHHYVSWSVSSALTRHWSIYGNLAYDLDDSGGPLSWTTRLVYDDECFAFVTDMRREYTYDRDYLSGYSVTVNVVFKTLGSAPFNVF